MVHFYLITLCFIFLLRESIRLWNLIFNRRVYISLSIYKQKTASHFSYQFLYIITIILEWYFILFVWKMFGFETITCIHNIPGMKNFHLKFIFLFSFNYLKLSVHQLINFKMSMLKLRIQVHLFGFHAISPKQLLINHYKLLLQLLIPLCNHCVDLVNLFLQQNSLFVFYLF